MKKLKKLFFISCTLITLGLILSCGAYKVDRQHFLIKGCADAICTTEEIDKFMDVNLNLPSIGISNPEEKIWLRFSIDKKGNMLNIEVDGTSNPEIIKEIERVGFLLKEQKKFLPAQQGSIPYYTNYMTEIKI